VGLCDALLDQAQRHHADPAPGFTHLQHAQPVTLGHEIAKHVQPLLRDLSSGWRTGVIAPASPRWEPVRWRESASVWIRW
jgi:argininosuccinate lyase